MPSDDRLFELLAKPIQAFHSAVAATVEHLRGRIADAEAQVSKSARGPELGAFAAGRIDFDRFAAVATRESVEVAPDALDRIRRANDTLKDLLEQGRDPLRVTVDPGGHVVASVEAGLASIGRAFGAARAVEMTRTGAWSDEHAKMTEVFSFDRWNPAERAIAPPLFVTVDGADLAEVDGLAGFLDGGVKIVLLVQGDAPPAPLARLITPGVFVVQTDDPEKGLERFGAWAGPGILAVLPKGCAEFVHDPEGGAAVGDRLTVLSLPEEGPGKTLGRLSVFQQTEPLRQLEALKAQPAATPLDVSGDGRADPVDKLAAWLLSEADLTGIE
jgi:hypothetical protein